jgi:hypothetical protein
MHDTYRRSRECECSEPLTGPDTGTCVYCGKWLLERDPETGIPTAELLPEAAAA